MLDNHSKGPEHRTTILSAILREELDRMDDTRTLIWIW